MRRRPAQPPSGYCGQVHVFLNVMDSLRPLSAAIRSDHRQLSLFKRAPTGRPGGSSRVHGRAQRPAARPSLSGRDGQLGAGGGLAPHKLVKKRQLANLIIKNMKQSKSGNNRKLIPMMISRFRLFHILNNQICKLLPFLHQPIQHHRSDDLTSEPRLGHSKK